MITDYKEYFRQYYKLRWQRVRAEWFTEHGPCVRCGSWENLEIDHKERNVKVNHKVWFWSKERRDEELSKCQVLCHSCHVLRHTIEMMTQIEHNPKGRYWRPSRCKCIKCRPELHVKWLKMKLFV